MLLSDLWTLRAAATHMLGSQFPSCVLESWFHEQILQIESSMSGSDVQFLHCQISSVGLNDFLNMAFVDQTWWYPHIIPVGRMLR